MTVTNKIKVAVVQAAPIIFDKKKTVAKVVSLIQACADHEANLILFPESFIPAYPRGLDFGAVVGSRTSEGRRLWQRYSENAIEIPGAETDTIGKAVRAAGAFTAIGITERDKISGSLYCSIVYFDKNGHVSGKHRKLKPTGTERLIWGEGDGSTLTTFDLGFAKVGGLICWENFMPEARLAMYKKGIEIYLAPTADARKSWQNTMRHIAMEGRCFVLGCNQYVKKTDYPDDLKPLLENQPETMSAGGSVIVSPMGEVLAGPSWNKEEILFSDLDLTEITRAKMDFDPIGHYARPDVFHLKINDQPETISIKNK